MRKRVLIVAAVGVVSAVTGLVIANAGADSPDPPARFDHAHSDLDLSAARRFTDFPLYFAGARFRDLPLTAINRRADGESNYVSLKYGTCQVVDTTGCPAPLEIQIFPACKRNPSLYQLAPDIDGPSGPLVAAPYPRERLTLRGVPAAFFDAGRRLEVYTGDVTVVLWGYGRNQLLDAAQSLRGLSAAIEPAEPLPALAPGHLEGRLACR